MLKQELPFEPPMGWAAGLAAYAWTQEGIGRSEAMVFRLEADGRPSLFMKTAPTGPFSELRDEIARLRWLAATGIGCPQPLAEEHDGERDWLLMSAVPGRNLASSPELGPQRVVEIAAQALRQLHTLDPRGCPFDHRLELRIASAQARLATGLIDEGDFDDERAGRTAADLFSELLARRPADEDLIVTHGDACLPNLLAEAGHFTGFIDCARLGTADRHQDLALATWSIRYNLGEAWVEPFLRYYGVEADPERLAFYRLLDEFF